MERKKPVRGTDWNFWTCMLGTTTDSNIAKMTGLSEDTVRNKRWGLGIEPFQRKCAKIDWNINNTKDLGKITDQIIARKLGCKVSTVSRKRKLLGIAPIRKRTYVDWNKWNKLLGVLQDYVLADAIGCNEMTVRKRRIKLGIKRNTEWIK